MDDLGGGGEGLASLPTYMGFSQKLGGAALGPWLCYTPLASPSQGCLCCTGRPMAPHLGASTPQWALPAVGQGALGAALSPRSVCPRMELQVLDSAAVPRAGPAHTAAWLCVLKTAMPTMGQGPVTRYK